MLHLQDREYPVSQVRNGIGSSVVRATVTCSRPDCGFVKNIDSPTTLHDSVITRRLKRDGWLLSKKHNADVCPRCLGASKLNELAEKFPTTLDGQPVPTRSDIRCAAEQVRATDRQKINGALDKLFRKPDPVEEPVLDAPTPPQSDDDRIARMAGDMADMRAAFELNLDQSQRVIEQNERLIAQSERMIELNKKLFEREDQAITAITRLAENMSRQNQAMMETFASATSALRDMANLVRQQVVTLPPQPQPKPEPVPMKPMAPLKRGNRLTQAIDARLHGTMPVMPAEEAKRIRAARRPRVRAAQA